ncbi:MAG: glycosyltransferase family 2 protein [Blautia wexlerae]
MISVIVPVYRVEQYLDACIESILGQTFQDSFELRSPVDDGSPITIWWGRPCDRYAGQDARIHVVHQENRGLSGARNTGIRPGRREVYYIHRQR